MTTRKAALHEGFSPDVEFDAPETYSALMRDWPKVKPLLEADAFELQTNYLGAAAPASDARTRIWDTMLEPALRCHSDGNYELTCRFTWQAEADLHTVTFYIEDGEPRGSSIDG